MDPGKCVKFGKPVHIYMHALSLKVLYEKFMMLIAGKGF